MRNFFKFLGKYHFFFLFILLQVLAFYLLVKNSSFHQSGYFNSTNAIIGNIYTYKSNVTDYLSLREINNRLAEENAELRNQLKYNYVPVDNSFAIIDDTLNKRKFRYFKARVINNSTNKQTNYLTLQNGGNLGLKTDMGVISEQGIVGIVKDISPNFCTVVSVLNTNFSTSVKIERTNDLCLIEWDGSDSRYAYLKDIALHVDVRKGDKVVTREASAIFPANIAVGTVVEVKDDAGSVYHTVKLKLATDFSKLQYVYLVDNYFKEEQKNLEIKSNLDDK
jgi:rod shape-determining protein MreC